MNASKPMEIKGYFRAFSHLPVWEIVERAGIWKQLGVRATFEFCGGSTEAEAALLEGRIDFVSGNHISPYALIARGKPLVCLASPSNGVRDSLASREPIKSVSDLRGQRIADTSVLGADREYRHMRGNHNLY